MEWRGRRWKAAAPEDMPMLQLQSLPAWLLWLCLVLILALAVVAGIYVCRVAQEEEAVPPAQMTVPAVPPPPAAPHP